MLSFLHLPKSEGSQEAKTMGKAASESFKIELNAKELLLDIMHIISKC